MKNVMSNFKTYSVYLGILFMSLSISSCSDDDDGVIDEGDDFTGSITATDQPITDNTIIVDNVTVGQDSWLVAVHSDEEDTDNFIAGPVLIQEPGESDLSLTLDANADLEGDADGDEIVLKLYADDDDGIWNDGDEPITDAGGALVTETIVLMTEQGDFASFDTNEDGMLDADEVPNTYANNFEEWDVDEDGSLNEEEFYNTSFWNTDADDDGVIDEDEWNAGYTGMYGTYVDDDFATYDADTDGSLDQDEWNDVFVDSPWFTNYDANEDTFVTEEEWDTGLYTDWDLNEDGVIDEDEYNNYYGYTSLW